MCRNGCNHAISKIAPCGLGVVVPVSVGGIDGYGAVVWNEDEEDEEDTLVVVIGGDVCGVGRNEYGGGPRLFFGGL
jgi:hypothetical protein